MEGSVDGRETNDNPKPFTWTADPAAITASRRGHQALGPNAACGHC